MLNISSFANDKIYHPSKTRMTTSIKELGQTKINTYRVSETKKQNIIKIVSKYFAK